MKNKNDENNNNYYNFKPGGLEYQNKKPLYTSFLSRLSLQEGKKRAGAEVRRFSKEWRKATHTLSLYYTIHHLPFVSPNHHRRPARSTTGRHLYYFTASPIHP